MWIRSHKHENSKDSYEKIGAFLAVQFACMTNDSLRWSRCRCHTQEFSSSILQIRETKFAFPLPKNRYLETAFAWGPQTFTQHERQAGPEEEPRTSRPGGGGGKKGRPTVDWVLSYGIQRHQNWREPIIDFTHFLFQCSYFSNTSKTLMFTWPICS